ncbi:acyltransferase family protein [Oryzobacter sp. R7]|uniref:acyltransferase family protein n=1 Tax=Oryzobacter faecalis TaxID=3388656 RepID=UPI00398CEA1C
MTSPPAPAAADTRVSALDGLRGVTIVLVVLGHAGNLVWPTAALDEVPVLRSFLHGGAVGVFFVVGGYIVTRGLLRELDRGTSDPVRFYLRRLVRLGVQVVPLAGAVLLVHAVDPIDPFSTRATVESSINLVTHTTNLHAATDLLSTRSDLGHMWYLAVQQQVYLVLPLLVVLLGGRRWLLASVLVEGAVASVLWRHHVLDTAGWIEATVSTLCRADAVLVGALVAILAEALRRRRGLGAGTIAVGALALLVLMGTLGELGQEFLYLRWWGVLFTIAAATTVLGIALVDRPTVVTRILSLPALTWLGRASLAIFIWHLPLFFLVQRHTTEWTWPPRAITTFALLAGVVWVAHRYLDEPARRWLRVHLRPEPPPEAAAPPVAPEPATTGTRS